MIRQGTRVRRSPAYSILAVAVLCGVLVSACGSQQKPVARDFFSVPSQRAIASVSVPTAPMSTTSVTSSTTENPATCPYPTSGFDCDFQRRFAAVQAYVATRPGTVGIVVRDRQTGAVWRNQYANTMVWTASTIKLAMTVDLFLRDRAGAISLTSGDRDLIQRMLHSSDDNAADSLWFKYAGADHMTFNNDFARYGLTSLSPKRGYTHYFPYWGFQKCTPNDLDRLVNYVLTKLPTSTKDYIVDQLMHVDPDQQWGVWGAGPAALPGNKDGWSLEDTGQVMNTVGWVGPGQRYTLAVMNSLNGHGGYTDGRTTDSEIAKLLFAGRTL
ncbi:MAG TPA: tat pathway signal sequence [Pseudonocardiaceae bacterium]|nr:tat pathway signal sequence [Pseudonocardiaceae bacterium]